MTVLNLEWPTIPIRIFTIALWAAGLGMAAIPVLIMLGLLGNVFDPKSVWFFWTIGIALCIAGSFSARGATMFGVVAFSLLVGGGAQLWLTEPLWFPAIQLKPNQAVDVLMFGLIGIQAALALWVLYKSRPNNTLNGWMGKFGYTRILLFLLLSFAFSIPLQAYLPRGFYVSMASHLVAASAIIIINLASMAAMLSVPTPHQPLYRLSPLFLAAGVLLTSTALACLGFERLPHVEDEVAYLFQAKTFAHGALSAPAPHETLRPGLDIYLLEIRDERWFATTPHGWPAVLAIGVWFGVPWLVNPLLGAASVLLAHAIARQMVGRNFADVLAILMSVSPWFLQANASMMPHTTVIFLILASWWLLMHSITSNRSIWISALIAGLAMGWVFATRRPEGVIIGVLTGIWLLGRWKKGDDGVRTIAFTIGAIATGATYFAYNFALTGDILLTPLDRYLSMIWPAGANSFGFGPDIGPPEQWLALDMAPGHGPLEGALNTLHNVFAMQLELFGWGIGSLALVFALFIWGKPARNDIAMVVISLSVAGLMFFYWSSGGFYLGPRYWYGMFFPVLFLSSGGFMALSTKLTNMGVDQEKPFHVLLVFCLFGLLVFTPWRGVEKFNGYNNYRSDIARQTADLKVSDALVFASTPKNPASIIYMNDPFLADDHPIILMDLGDETNQAAITAYPHRTPFFLATPTD